jgi:hypothetical protein
VRQNAVWDVLSFVLSRTFENENSDTPNFYPQKRLCYSLIYPLYIALLIADHGVDIPPGYTRMNFRCMGKTVYCSPFATRAMASIVEDRTQHNGGVWKAGPRKTWAEQGCPQELRSDTYDGSLTWIGDRRK